MISRQIKQKATPWKIPNDEKVELSDEQLDEVAGGLFIQPDGEWTCSKCGKEFNSYDERMRHEVTCRG